MSNSWLYNYGPSNIEVLFLLFVIAVLAAIGYGMLIHRWQGKERQLRSDMVEQQRQCEITVEELQGEMVELRSRYDPSLIKALQDHHQQVIAHEFMKGLHFIDSQCEDMMTGLRPDQLELQDHLNKIRAKTYDMSQHAKNVVEYANLEQNADKREMVNLRRLVESTVKELFPYAEASGVTLLPKLHSLDPIAVNRLLIEHLCSNVIHNAIKYSSPGDVVTINLRGNVNGEKQALIEVRDHGKGIGARDQENIFELNTRGENLVVPGSGLGLNYARRIARQYGGDLVLVESKIKEGSTFLITLPYMEESGLP